MGKKKQRKGAPDFDDDEFPEQSDDVAASSADAPAPIATDKKPSKSKKAKKVNLQRE